MSRTWYERMSILDYSFLAFEGASTPMHIAALAVFETGSLIAKNGGVDAERIYRHTAARLASIPRYRQKLAAVPVENRGVWIDDDKFDLANHLHHTSLPRPGSEAQLRELCARLLERPLNRSKPLWEIWVIEGLERRHFALLIKVHHCMVDGLGGAELLAALLSAAPDTDIPEPEEWRARPAPSASELLGDEVRRRVKMSVDFVRRLGGAARATPEREDLGRKLTAAWQLIRQGVRWPTATPFNQRVGAYRRFHWTTHNLAEIKAIKDRLGGTVNDVVLTVVAGAVRQFLQQRNYAIDGLDFRVAVPVNVRAPGEGGGTGNRVSAWLFALPIQERDPVRRLQAIRERSAELKEGNHSLGGEVLTEAAEWATTNVLTLGALLANQTQPYNLIVTNVPGPQFPLFLLGARMTAAYPQVPLFEHQCLGVALFSYAGNLHWGFNADFDALPDVDQFAEGIERSFRELRKAAIPRISARRATGASGQRRTARIVVAAG